MPRTPLPKDALRIPLRLRTSLINILRTGRLIHVATATNARRTHDDREDSREVLRAAVVMLHATMEEFLRDLAAKRLPHANASTLDHIPFLGIKDSIRAEKVLLGHLAAFRGRTVDDLISASVSAHLSRLSFGDTNDIVRLLKLTRIPEERVADLFPPLSKMMKRRHDIVHRADLKPPNRRGSRELAPISRKTVIEWGNLVNTFIERLEELNKEYPAA
jgi:hypothetical protein